MQLRKYQQKIVDNVRQQIRNGQRRILIQLPCGGGKTAIASFILKGTINNGHRACMMAHRAELVSQASKTLTNINVPHGVIQAGISPNLLPLMQVASVGTLRQRLDKVPMPIVLVVDEAQHQASRTWREITDYYYEHGAIIIGLSATPIRLSGEPLSDCYDVMVQGPSIKELMDLGYLCRYKYLAPPQVMDLSGISTVCGDYAKGELFQAVSKSYITGDAIQHYKSFLNGKRAIAFCISVEHAKSVAKQFCESGIKAEAVNGNTPAETRAATLERFKRGETLVLTNVDIYTEGADIPSCEGVIMLRPTQSLGLYIQMSGRALRPDPDNPFKVSVILDHCGNVFRHNLPDTERVWDLYAAKTKRRKSESCTVAIRACPKCFWVHKPAPVCPGCGFVYPVESRQIEERAGELEEIKYTPEQKKARRMQVGMARSVEDLKQIAKERGYKSGWVWYQAKMKGLR